MTTDFRALCADLIEAMTDDSTGCWQREADVIDRARALLAEPVAEGPTVMEIIELADEIEAAELGQVDLVRAALARWGRRAAAPVPVSERPWERQGWCDKDGRCWFGWADEPDASWSFCKPSERDTATVSIPANALPLPEQEVSE